LRFIRQDRELYAIWQVFALCVPPDFVQALSFGRTRIKKMEFMVGVVVGFALGYGVRSVISRHRRARARREIGKE
jgi:hypothetical protein